MNELEDGMSMTDVARLAEVGITAVSNWRKRHADFPSPCHSLGQELFVTDEIARWLSGRKISKNNLKTGESPGITYGDRFLRNLVKPGASATSVEGKVKALSVVEVGQRLWAVLDRLRSSYDVDSYVELVLGLLYLRVREPELWQRLAREHSGGAVRDLLVQAELPADPYTPRVRLFEVITRVPRADRALVETVHAFNQIDLSDCVATTAAVGHLVDHLLTWFERSMGTTGGEIFTPHSLVRCMQKMVDLQPRDHVYDPFCRSGELLVAAAAHMECHGARPGGLSVSGQTLSERSWRLTKLNAALRGINVDLGSGTSCALHSDVYPGRRFDVVLANPPFNMSDCCGRRGFGDQRWTYGVPPDHNANFAWLQHVVSKLTPYGRAAVLMPNMTTTVGNTAEAAIRTRMVQAGVIDCVVALPARLFRSTGIAVSLWLLRGAGDMNPPEILMIDATDLGAMVDRVQRFLTDYNLECISREYDAWRDRRCAGTYEGQTGFTRSVTYAEIHERDYVLNPRVYVQSAVDDVGPELSLAAINELRADLDDLRTKSLRVRAALDEALTGVVLGQLPSDAAHEGWTQIPLGDVCDVLAGPGTLDRGEHRLSWVPVVLPRNIKHNRITDDELDAVEPGGASKLFRYRLAPGDVVCTRTGTLGRYGLVRPEQAHWLLGPGCMRLRPTECVDSEYLTYYLNSPVAHAWLTDNATGSAIQYINTKTLGRMPLALPPLSVQREIGAILGALDSEVSIQSQIVATTQTLGDLLLPLLMTGASR